MTERKDYCTIKETAVMLGVNQQKIFNLLRSPNNPFINASRIGWQWAIPVSDIEAYKQSQVETK